MDSTIIGYGVYRSIHAGSHFSVAEEPVAIYAEKADAQQAAYALQSRESTHGRDYRCCEVYPVREYHD